MRNGSQSSSEAIPLIAASGLHLRKAHPIRGGYHPDLVAFYVVSCKGNLRVFALSNILLTLNPWECGGEVNHGRICAQRHKAGRGQALTWGWRSGWVATYEFREWS